MENASPSNSDDWMPVDEQKHEQEIMKSQDFSAAISNVDDSNFVALPPPPPPPPSSNIPSVKVWHLVLQQPIPDAKMWTPEWRAKIVEAADRVKSMSTNRMSLDYLLSRFAVANVFAVRAFHACVVIHLVDFDAAPEAKTSSAPQPKIHELVKLIKFFHSSEFRPFADYYEECFKKAVAKPITEMVAEKPVVAEKAVAAKPITETVAEKPVAEKPPIYILESQAWQAEIYGTRFVKFELENPTETPKRTFNQMSFCEFLDLFKDCPTSPDWEEPHMKLVEAYANNLVAKYGYLDWSMCERFVKRIKEGDWNVVAFNMVDFKQVDPNFVVTFLESRNKEARSYFSNRYRELTGTAPPKPPAVTLAERCNCDIVALALQNETIPTKDKLSWDRFLVLHKQLNDEDVENIRSAVFVLFDLVDLTQISMETIEDFCRTFKYEGIDYFEKQHKAAQKIPDSILKNTPKLKNWDAACLKEIETQVMKTPPLFVLQQAVNMINVNKLNCDQSVVVWNLVDFTKTSKADVDKALDCIRGCDKFKEYARGVAEKKLAPKLKILTPPEPEVVIVATSYAQTIVGDFTFPKKLSQMTKDEICGLLQDRPSTSWVDVWKIEAYSNDIVAKHGYLPPERLVVLSTCDTRIALFNLLDLTKITDAEFEWFQNIPSLDRNELTYYRSRLKMVRNGPKKQSDIATGAKEKEIKPDMAKPDMAKPDVVPTTAELKHALTKIVKEPTREENIRFWLDTSHNHIDPWSSNADYKSFADAIRAHIAPVTFSEFCKETAETNKMVLWHLVDFSSVRPSDLADRLSTSTPSLKSYILSQPCPWTSTDNMPHIGYELKQMLDMWPWAKHSKEFQCTMFDTLQKNHGLQSSTSFLTQLRSLNAPSDWELCVLPHLVDWKSCSDDTLRTLVELCHKREWSTLATNIWNQLDEAKRKKYASMFIYPNVNVSKLRSLFL